MALADSWKFIEGIRGRLFLFVRLQFLPGRVKSQEYGAVLYNVTGKKIYIYMAFTLQFPKGSGIYYYFSPYVVIRT